MAESASPTGDVELIDQDVRYGGAVQRAIKGCESVIHFATVSINKSVADPDESIDVNMVGNHNVFAAAAEEGVRRIVYASSASVYGDPERLPMHEDDRKTPLTPYCISKLAGEQLLGFYERQKGLDWIALRFFNVYGPGQKTSAYYTSVINHFVNRIANGEPPVIDGRGDQSMDFIHVSDVARAVVMALDCEQSNMPINIGTGSRHERRPAGRDPDRRDRRGRRTDLQPARRARVAAGRGHHPRGGARLGAAHPGR